MLDGMLHGYSGRSEGAGKSSNVEVLKDGGEDEVAGAQAERLHKLAGKVRHFVEGEGDLGGAKFEEYVRLPVSDISTRLTDSDNLATCYQMKNFPTKRAQGLVTRQCLTPR